MRDSYALDTLITTESDCNQDTRGPAVGEPKMDLDGLSLRSTSHGPTAKPQVQTLRKE
ncbi:hypothetical protein EIP91_003877 [Steccherinum ochraceum]|uniref:Uncharacterized protein n=1 Tax=Steccherinum ochraceum TaxID=92696 RepID=A0A4R0R9R0_9APHY|nr:hypothetical protein EIP91_003877 [Steccherinum ochraceum]